MIPPPFVLMVWASLSLAFSLEAINSVLEIIVNMLISTVFPSYDEKKGAQPKEETNTTQMTALPNKKKSSSQERIQKSKLKSRPRSFATTATYFLPAELAPLPLPSSSLPSFSAYFSLKRS